MAKEREEALAIVSVNWKDGWPIQARLNNDEVIPITQLYDDDGVEITEFDPDKNLDERLEWFIAGPTKDGYWITEQYGAWDWEPVKLH